MGKKLLAFFLLLLSAAAPACQRQENRIEYKGGVVSVAPQEDIRLDADGIGRLLLTNEIGTVRIVPAEGNAVIIRAVKTVQGANKTENEALLDNISICAAAEDGRLVIGARAAGNPEQDFWEWLDTQENGEAEAAVNYTVQAPAGIGIFEINNRTGSIAVEDVTGSFLIKGGAADLAMRNTRLTGRSLMILQSGDAVFDIDPAGASEIVINNGLGDVDITFPAGARLQLKASIAAGNITGDVKKEVKGPGTVEQLYSGGGIQLTVSVTTGDIAIHTR